MNIGMMSYSALCQQHTITKIFQTSFFFSTQIKFLPISTCFSQKICSHYYTHTFWHDTHVDIFQEILTLNSRWHCCISWSEGELSPFNTKNKTSHDKLWQGLCTLNNLKFRPAKKSLLSLCTALGSQTYILPIGSHPASKTSFKTLLPKTRTFRIMQQVQL